MSKLEPTVGPYDVTPLKRVSWGAIFGGTFISLALMVLLGSLGIAIGATTIDPQTGDSPSARAFGIGAGIWWIGSSVLALFGGGWAAGRLAGPRRPLESTLHGLVTWSFTTTIAVALMTTAVGSMVSGAMRVLGTASSIVVQAATGARAEDDVSGVNLDRRGVESRQADVRDLPDPDAIWQEVWRDAQRILRENPRTAPPAQGLGRAAEQEAGEPTGEIEDRQTTDRAGGAVGQTQDRAGQVTPSVTDPQDALDALELALARLYRNARQNVAAVDRDAVIEVLVAHTGMTRAEAQDAVRDWGNRFQGAWQPQQPQQIRQPPLANVDTAAAAERAANAVASAAWWTFFYFIFTAASGGVGGMLGSMRRRRDTTVDIRETRSVTP